MDTGKAFDLYYAKVHDTDREGAHQMVDSFLAEGLTPEDIVFHVLLPSIDKMIDGFLKDKIILSQHFIATKISEEIVDKLIPMFKTKPGYEVKMVIGCAYGDFHGLGKKIVAGTLKAHMIEVVDLGLSVKPDTFIEEAIKCEAEIIGVSSMMVHTATGQQGPVRIRRLLKEKGLEDRIKLIVGGAPYRFDADLYREVQADDWASNGLEAVTKVLSLSKKVKYAN